ncbi:MAG: hypothetical protein MJ176_09385, partial [Treponema sp.]|nr:hypothetical protein [Treponema sp.]
MFGTFLTWDTFLVLRNEPSKPSFSANLLKTVATDCFHPFGAANIYFPARGKSNTEAAASMKCKRDLNKKKPVRNCLPRDTSLVLRNEPSKHSFSENLLKTVATDCFHPSGAAD